MVELLRASRACSVNPLLTNCLAGAWVSFPIPYARILVAYHSLKYEVSLFHPQFQHVHYLHVRDDGFSSPLSMQGKPCGITVASRNTKLIYFSISTFKGWYDTKPIRVQQPCFYTPFKS